MSKVLCNGCGNEIPPQRLQILPYTTTCVKCSTEQPKAGRLYTKGRGEEIEVELEILERTYYNRIGHYDREFSIHEDSIEMFEEEDLGKDPYVAFQNSNEYLREEEEDA